MTHFKRGKSGRPYVVLAPESDKVCELCGTTAETRPYGPNGERICYPCAMKDPDTTERMFNKFISECLINSLMRV